MESTERSEVHGIYRAERGSSSFFFAVSGVFVNGYFSYRLETADSTPTGRPAAHAGASSMRASIRLTWSWRSASGADATISS